MATPRLFWRFPSDAASAIAASSEGSQGEVENLLYSDLDSKWITTGAGAAETVTLDLGSAQSIQAFALLGHDLDDTETSVQICGNTADSWASPAFVHDCTYRADHLVEFFDDVEVYRYWRFRFTKASAAHVRSAGRLLLGPYYSLGRGMKRGQFSLGHEDLSEQRVTHGGQVYADIRATPRTLSARFDFLSSADMGELRALAATYGTHTPWLYSGDHANEPVDWLLYGTLTALGGHDWSTYDGDHLWTASLELREAL